MIPNIDEEGIQGEFTLKQIDAPMPEAPWIRRWTNGGGDNTRDGCDIKFTDHIVREGEDGEVEENFEEDDTQGGVDISEIRDEFKEEEEVDISSKLNKDLRPHKITKKQKNVMKI